MKSLGKEGERNKLFTINDHGSSISDSTRSCLLRSLSADKKEEVVQEEVYNHQPFQNRLWEG